jgi:hypothetical protein
MPGLGYKIPTWIATDFIKDPQPQAMDVPADVGASGNGVLVDDGTGLPGGSMVWIAGAALLALVVLSKGK